MDHTFAIVSRDGLWRDGEMIEERLSHGVAEQRGRVITAGDMPDAELARICDQRFDEIVRSVKGTRVRVRGVAFARRVQSANGEDVFSSAVITASSVVTTPERFAEDIQLARPAASERVKDGAPILWSNGSASVLLHEAIGHAAEEGAARIEWPEWLRVRDEPRFRLDDAGNIARTSDLLREPPASLRRATFKDVAIPRMTRVVIEGERTFELPDEYIEVQLTAGGRYDPLTEHVSISVAQAVDSRGEPLQPFVIRTTRDRIRASLIGARGVPVRYPGVICSSDGQKLVVECFAPVMLTAEIS
jgi:hypothetical protein